MNELNNHVKVPFHTFKGCKCEAAPKIVKMYGEDKSHQFLMGLNDDQFSHIRSKPLPNLDKILNMVKQEDSHKWIMIQRESKSETAFAFAVNTFKMIQISDCPACKHCGKIGYEEANCFELVNRTPTSIFRGKTPYEILFKVKPTYDHVKIFGCLCYVHQRPKQKDKFASRNRKCMFVDYPFGKKG